MDNDDVRSLRRRLGLTQEQLAERMKVEPNTVARWERGELGITASTADRLKRVAESLGSGSAVTQSSAFAIDPYHQDILDGLRRRLDPAVFQRCAAALLRRDWPTLVLISGSGDDGFDGAIDSGTRGTSFPLVVTTGERLVRNFVNSIDRAVGTDWKPTSVIFATSRHVTPRTRRKLRDEARLRQIDLRQVYDQEWIALRLYQEPDWCKRLLQLTGRPQALSPFPATRRPVIGNRVHGREREMQWLKDHRSDCVVVGEPGSGKTFLLRDMALQRAARFLVDDDRAQIANDVRRLNPKAVIVDDAHVDPDRIARLRQIRQELSADFYIVATSWPSGADSVRAALNIGRKSILKLERIDADTMVKIIRSAGFEGPDELIRIIRVQAAGRPGLAATLAHLCLVGDIKEVVNGEALLRELAPSLSTALSQDSLGVLAPFALGGDSGVRQDRVARFLNRSPLDVRSALAELSAAGVVGERPRSAVAVDPEPMRWTLVKQVFGGGFGLPIEPALRIVEDRHDALHTLIGARTRGAQVPDLERWLEEANATDLWVAYASSGAAAARYVLERQPELIDELAEAALVNAPETAIPILLERWGREHRLFSEPRSDLDRLKQWLNGFVMYQESAVKRRVTLIRETADWWKLRRDGDRAIKAMCAALAPGFDYSALDPGMGNTFQRVSGILRDVDLRELTRNWPVVLAIVRDSDRVPWNALFDLIEDWLEPSVRIFPPPKASDETRHLLREFAGTMAKDLAAISREHPGVQHRIGDLADRAKLTLDLSLDCEFEQMFPSRIYDGDDWEEQHQGWLEDVGKLAEGWTNRPMDEIASVVARLHGEAVLAHMHHLRLEHLCTKLAERVPKPARTAEALIAHKLAAPLIAPFLVQAATARDRDWIRLARCLLSDPEYRWNAVQVVLTHQSAPADLRCQALSVAHEMPMLEDFMRERCREMSESTIAELLQSSDARVAVATALGYWCMHRGAEDAAFDAVWRRAVLRSAAEIPGGMDSAYWVGDILAKDADLAADWLVLNQSVRYSPHTSTSKVAEETAGALDSDRRAKVIQRLASAKEAWPSGKVMAVLVGGDMGLYRVILDSSELREHHLEPLHRELDDTWRRLASVALDAGYSEQAVIQATIGSYWFWSGSESAMWERRRAGFAAVMDDADSRIVRIGCEGAKEMNERKQAAMRREEVEAVEGREVVRRRRRR
ncbi:MAG: helix-turn-helix domain-containing protein [Spirochaetaceae bacterium]|nr:helix-turn-helix domain-containing protein [Spirochaetaceae bacterium]